MPEETQTKKTEEKKKVIRVRLPALNFWMLATLVLAIVLVYVFIKGFPTTGTSAALTSQEAAEKALNFINTNLVEAGGVTFVSVDEMSGVYKVTTTYQGQSVIVYTTKDGKYLILQQGIIDMTAQIPTATTTSQPQQTTKKDRPTVDLYVMSFCPYGVQAETIMKPVVDLLGGKADIRVRFIANVQGNTVDSVQSLHGLTEAQEDLRQLCIMKNYDQKTYWNYLMEINTNCYGKINTRDSAALETCWKSSASKAGIDVAKIQTCSNSTEGLNLLKADEQLTSQYGVSGSPTLIINGATYNGARSSEAFKQAICNSFTTAPTECTQTLSTSGSTASGGC
jgi:glutaredoxin